MSGKHPKKILYFHSQGEIVKIYSLTMLDEEAKVLSLTCRFLEEF
jgi:hypothetical protein